MKVVLLGVGNMGSAMVKAWLGSSTVETKNLTLIDNDPNKFAELQITQDAESVNNKISDADIIVLAIKPQDLESAAQQLAPVLSPKTIILSILAGISLSKLANCFSSNKKIIRAMPNMGAQICRSITAYVVSNSTDKSDAACAEKLLSALGAVEKLASEELMDPWCAVAGSGPGFIVRLMESFVSAAIDQGFSAEIADKMVKETFFGTASLVHDSKLPLEEFRKMVTSKGGTTAAGLQVFDAQDVSKTIKHIVEAAANRGKELNAKL